MGAGEGAEEMGAGGYNLRPLGGPPNCVRVRGLESGNLGRAADGAGDCVCDRDVDDMDAWASALNFINFVRNNVHIVCFTSTHCRAPPADT